MPLHDFELILPDVHDLTDKMINDIYEARCDDALLGMYNNMVRLGFTREAEDYSTAVKSAMIDVKKAGYESRVIEVRTK